MPSGTSFSQEMPRQTDTKMFSALIVQLQAQLQSKDPAPQKARKYAEKLTTVFAAPHDNDDLGVTVSAWFY
jgi:hypothetical protein